LGGGYSLILMIIIYAFLAYRSREKYAFVAHFAKKIPLLKRKGVKGSI
jgi:hypothetical protein